MGLGGVAAAAGPPRFRQLLDRVSAAAAAVAAAGAGAGAGAGAQADQTSAVHTRLGLLSGPDPCKPTDGSPPSQYCTPEPRKCPGKPPCSGKGNCDEEDGKCDCFEGWHGFDCSVDLSSNIMVHSDCMNMTMSQIGSCYNSTHFGMCTGHKLTWKRLCYRTCEAMQGQVCSLANREAFCSRAPDCEPLCLELFSATCSEILARFLSNPHLPRRLDMIKSIEAYRAFQDSKPVPWFEQDSAQDKAAGKGDDESTAGGSSGASGAGGNVHLPRLDDGSECSSRNFERCHGPCRWTGFSKYGGACVPEDSPLSDALAGAAADALGGAAAGVLGGVQRQVDRATGALDALAGSGALATASRVADQVAAGDHVGAAGSLVDAAATTDGQLGSAARQVQQVANSDEAAAAAELASSSNPTQLLAREAGAEADRALSQALRFRAARAAAPNPMGAFAKEEEYYSDRAGASEGANDVTIDGGASRQAGHSAAPPEDDLAAAMLLPGRT